MKCWFYKTLIHWSLNARQRFLLPFHSTELLCVGRSQKLHKSFWLWLEFFIFFYFFEEVQVVQIIPEWLHKLSSSGLPECAAWYFRITQVFVWINDPWSRVTWIPTVFTQPEDRSRRVHINIVLSCPLSFWKVLNLGISAGMQVVWGCRPWSLASNFGLRG